MGLFEERVRNISRAITRELSPVPNVRGYIPKGGIDRRSWTATVRYPNPRQGMDPGQIPEHDGPPGSYLEAHGVPLPRPTDGTIAAVEQAARDQPVGVVIGFQGGALDRPHIIQLLNLSQDLSQKTATANRQGPSAQQAATAAPAALPSPRVASPPPPLTGVTTPPPAQTLDEVKRQTQHILNNLNSPFGGERTRRDPTQPEP